MSEKAAQRCSGCGLVSPPGEDRAPPSRYNASAGCWAVYERLLARSYGDSEHRTVHQLIVDAYAVQHPKSETHGEVVQLALCLMTLQLFVEKAADVRLGPQLHQRMAANLPDVRALEPPQTDVGMTAADVLAAESAPDYARLAREWATVMWQAWASHHPTIRTWNRHVFGP